MSKNLPAVQATLGPAMRRLTEKQRAFVNALREVPPGRNGKPDQTEAARRAGYSSAHDSLKVIAYNLMQNPRIHEAIKETALGLMSSEGIGLTAMLLDIAYGIIPATPTERMKAAAMVFNRTGIIETTQHTVKVEHTIDNHDALEKVAQFAKVLGLEPKTLLGQMGMEVIDGEFVEIAPAEDDANLFDCPADAD